MTEKLLEMTNISKTYPGVKALQQVSLEVKKGEVHALVGENGAGKSTLIKILAGVIQPDEGGIIKINGKETSFQNASDAMHQGISVNYQDLSLFPNLSVAENITIGQSAFSGMRMKWGSIKKTAKAALDRLGIDLDIDVQIENLSIAKQQLVSIARAIAFDAKLIILDEPTSSLSSGEVELLFRIIKDLKQKGISILFVSHKLDELFEVSDRFTVLRDGQWVGRYDRSELDESKLIKLMVGRNVEYERLTSDGTPVGKTVFEVKGLSKKGNFEDINFSVKAGEIVGITGLVGAGRTELAQSIFGVQPVDRGEIILNGKVVNPQTTTEAVQLGMAYVPESRQLQGLVLSQSITHNISLSSLKQLMNRFRLVQPKKEEELAEQFIERLDIRPAISSMHAGQLSGGNQQKIVIGKWLAISPKLLIIDEPTNGIDIGAKTEIHRLLRELAKSGMAIIMISSELPEILASCDRILVMRQGRMVGHFHNDEQVTQVDIMNKALLGKPIKVPSEERSESA